MNFKIISSLVVVLVSINSFEVTAETRRCPVCDSPNAGRVVTDVNIKPQGNAAGDLSSSQLNRSTTSVDEIRSGRSIDHSGIVNENLNLDTSRAARREAMREAGIPTSKQPISQGLTDSGRHYNYKVPADGGGNQKMSVQQQTLDRNHIGQPHWEAGRVKSSGEINQYGVPRLDNNKSKVNY